MTGGSGGRHSHPSYLVSLLLSTSCCVVSTAIVPLTLLWPSHTVGCKGRRLSQDKLSLAQCSSAGSATWIPRTTALLPSTSYQALVSSLPCPSSKTAVPSFCPESFSSSMCPGHVVSFVFMMPVIIYVLEYSLHDLSLNIM